MNHLNKTVAGLAVSLILGVSGVLAQSSGPLGPGAGGHGPMMGQGMGHGPGAGNHSPMHGPTAMLTKQDANSAADMGLVMDLVHNHARIKRTVTKLPDGIKTVTESVDPKVAQAIKAHVASMSGRLKDGREFNIFSTTLPVIFDNAHKITSVVEMTDKGASVTRTATDAKVVAALHAHAAEVTELVQDGMAGMRRGMTARMAMGPSGPRGAAGAAIDQGNRAQPTPQHRH